MRKFKGYVGILLATMLLGGCAPQYAPEREMPQSEAATEVKLEDSSIEEATQEEMNNVSGVEKSEAADTMWIEEEVKVVEYIENDESYNEILENDYQSVSLTPLSTFSIDVDTASYTNVRRMIQDGYYPDQDAVRIEEMINYFNYDYDEPEGKTPFSVQTELAPCPWNKETKLMLVGLQGKKIDKESLPSSNLVFLIDTSGSMDEYNKLPLVQTAFNMLVENLGDEDRISIVTYAGSETVVLDGGRSDKKEKIIEAINSLYSGGSTHGSAGIEKAYELAEKHFIKGGNNRVILATDGDLNVGLTSEEDLKTLIEEKRESGVYLSALGFGMGNYKDDKMEALAQNGNGNYYYIDSPLEARKVLVEEMGGTLYTIAKDVKIQVEFNPAVVKGYRLIGYENRMLQAEDFNDDTKDAGEIGAGHQVTALYEVVTVDSPMKIPGVELKYQDTESIDSKEWLTVSLRFKAPNGNESKLITHTVDSKDYNRVLSDNMLLAGSVAQFGMLLRDSQFKGTSSYESVLGQLKDVDDLLNDEYKAELYMLIKQVQHMGY